MVNSNHRALKIVAFHFNGIWKQRYEPSKHLEELHMCIYIYMCVCVCVCARARARGGAGGCILRNTYKTTRKFYIPNNYLDLIDSHLGKKGGNAVEILEGIPQMQVNLPSLISI
jgi:hypothetical protein